jgi:hypothetical protein
MKYGFILENETEIKDVICQKNEEAVPRPIW